MHVRISSLVLKMCGTVLWIILGAGLLVGFQKVSNANTPVTMVKTTVTDSVTVRNETKHLLLRGCEYEDHPDLRIIVLTDSRPKSLQTLLCSLNNLEMDGDTAVLEIWIDRNREDEVDNLTQAIASTFTWKKGKSRVHIHTSHAGLYGQWIETWCPPSDDTTEVALILEDDLSVSPYAYRWLKAAHAYYRLRTDIAGFTLQSNDVINATNGKSLPRPEKEVSFLYKLVGSWGFSPHPKAWRAFREWFKVAKKDKDFHPYVKGLLLTSWYQRFERRGRADSMWTMWFIYFCHRENLFTLYNNFANVFELPRKRYLAQHRQEPGLHYRGKSGIRASYLLEIWNDKYISFPIHTPALDFDGH